MNLLTLYENLRVHRAEKGEYTLSPPRYVASTNGGEWKAPCPNCEGTKRLVIHPNKRRQEGMPIGLFWCRDCGFSGGSISFARKCLGMSSKMAQALVNSDNWQPEPLPSGSRYLEAKGPKGEIAEINETKQHPSQLWQELMEKVLIELAIPVTLIIDNDLKKRGISEKSTQRGWLREMPYLIGKSYFTKLFRFDESASYISTFELVAGLWIINRTFGGKLVEIRCRLKKDDPKRETSRYRVIRSGARSHPFFLEIDRFENLTAYLTFAKTKHALFVVESSLDAIALYEAAGDLILCIATGAGHVNPTSEILSCLIKELPLFLVHDNDSVGFKMRDKWLEMLGDLIAAPVPNAFGKDIGEAVQKGMSLRDWVIWFLQKENLLPLFVIWLFFLKIYTFIFII